MEITHFGGRLALGVPSEPEQARGIVSQGWLNYEARAMLVRLPLVIVSALIGLGALSISGCESKRRAHESTLSAAPSSSVAPKAAAKSPFPPEARRDSPPKGIAESAFALGKKAPDLAGLASTAGNWSRAEKVTVVVFYRGHW